jgi:pimeloyl-ACP methyl ester carboxylesterase
MLPDRLTIHPFTHAVPGGGGRASVMVYVELRDRFNQHTRALGRMKLSILPPRTPTAEGDYTAETPGDSTWFIELFDPERNAQLFDDMVTRTYVFTLGELPEWLNAWAKAQGADTARLGITGFCWGGRTTLMYVAHNPGVKAAVAWYGPVARSYFPGDRTALDVAGRIKAAVLGLYGAADGGIPNDTVKKMRDALKAAGNTRSKFVLYPGTPHAFHADYRPSYRKQAADDGWKRCLAWFKANGLS